MGFRDGKDTKCWISTEVPAKENIFKYSLLDQNNINTMIQRFTLSELSYTEWQLSQNAQKADVVKQQYFCIQDGIVHL